MHLPFDPTVSRKLSYRFHICAKKLFIVFY